MAFNEFTKPFTGAYAGFGTHSTAATAGFVAAGLLAPLLFKNDDRGYAKTAMVTTPMLAAAYVAAPGLVDNARSAYTDFGQFWKTKPFSFKNGLPVWDTYADLQTKVNRSGPRVRAVMHDIMAEKALDHYSAIQSRPYNTSLHANEAIEKIKGFQNEYGNILSTKRALRASGQAIPAELTAEHARLFGQRRYMSYAMAEAERAAAGVDTLRSTSNTVGVRVRSYENLLARAEKNSAKDKFVRRLSSRVKTAERINFAYEHIDRGMTSLPATGFESMNPAAAAAEGLAGDAGKAQAIQTAIDRGWIGAESKIIYGVDEAGKRSHMIGAQIFHKKNSYKSLSLPFIRENESTVAMGKNWNLRGVPVKLWDLEKVQAADDAILANLSQSYEEIESAVQRAFHYGGSTDGNKFHVDTGGSLPPTQAIELRRRKNIPNMFSRFNGKSYDDLEWNEQAAANEQGSKLHGLTKVGSPGGLPEGVLEDKILEGLPAGELPSALKPEATLRSLSKNPHLDPESLTGIPRSRLDSTIYEDVLKVKSEDLFIQAREGMVTPQVKSLLGDIPEEAESIILKAMGEGEQGGRFQSWKSQFLDENRKVVERLMKKREFEAANRLDRWYDTSEIFQFWQNTSDYKKFKTDWVADANKWWSTPKGVDYSAYARSSIRKEIGHLYTGSELDKQVESVFSSYQSKLMEDPMNVIHARRLGAAGETIGLYSHEIDQAKLMQKRSHFVESLSFNPDTIGTSLELPRNQPIGMADNAAVFGKGNVTITGASRVVEDGRAAGYQVHTVERFGMSGAKAEIGMGGVKALLTKLDDSANAGLLDVINTVNRGTGVGPILASDTNLLTLATSSGLKTSNPYADMLETATELASRMVTNKYTHVSARLGAEFLEDMVEKHNYEIVTNSSGAIRLQAQHTAILAHDEQLRAIRQSEVKDRVRQFLNEMGGQANSLTAEPYMAAYAETAAAQTALGRTPMDMAEFANRGQRFSKLSAWDHTALDLPSEVAMTFDMFGEMKRLGHEGALQDVFEDVRWTRGDPRRAQKMVEHLKEGNFQKSLGEVVQVAPSGALSALDSRAGNSAFNPDWEKVQENFSIDLGTTLKDVGFGAGTTDVRYVPKLGMKAYKGAPDPYPGGFHSTELEQAYNSMLKHTEGIDLKNAPENIQFMAKAKVSEYLNLLSTELVGKEGVLRARGVHPNAAWGFAAARSTGVNAEGAAEPFTVLIGKEAAGRIEDQEIRNMLLSGEDVYGKMFRHPVSGAHSVKYRYSESAHLDINQFGIDQSLSGPYQLDHDKDAVAAIFFRKHSKGWKEAQHEIETRTSNQWMNYEGSQLFQGMEDPRVVTGKMFENEAAQKGLWGKKSYISELEEAVKADWNVGVAGRRAMTFKDRLLHGFTGQFSNQTTKMQLMLANNPNLRPGDRGLAFMDKLSFYTRQVTISAGKGTTGLGGHPKEILSTLNRAIDRGAEGVDEAQNAFTQIAEAAGFESVISEKTNRATGITHYNVTNEAGEKVLVDADKAIGMKANVAADYARSANGKKDILSFLTSPNNQKAARLSQQLTRNEITAQDAMRLMHQGEGVSSELAGGVAGVAGRSGSKFVKGVANIFGEKAGKAAEGVSYALGAANKLLEEAKSSGGASMKPAAKVLAAGLGIAAVAGILSSSIKSSNSHRPEERVGVTDRVPGEPISGSRSSNPKRRIMPAAQGVRTAVVSRVQQSLDLEVRAKTRDQGGEHEVAKMVERMAGGNNGNTNITVNRIGSWQQSASKARLRKNVREELDRY